VFYRQINKSIKCFDFLSEIEMSSITGYLSLNPSVSDAAVIGSKGSAVISEDMPLSAAWTLWEQSHAGGAAVTTMGNYSDCMQEIVTVKSVKQFWSMFNHIPQPSVLLQNKRIVAFENEAPRTVSSLMLFRQGVRPEWEDPANREGGHIHFQFRPNIAPGNLDEYWNNIVLALMGNTLEPIDGEYLPVVQGVRLVDKVTSQRPGGVRFEVWFGKPIDERHVPYLRSQLLAVMTLRLDGTHSQNPRCEVRYHSSATGAEAQL
jgi:translation initiation factor 4E